MAVGILTLLLRLPGCASLKEKRSRLKPLLARLHREFNVSAAEMGHNDAWQEAVIGCAVLGNDPAHLQRVLQNVTDWININWPDIELNDDVIEII